MAEYIERERLRDMAFVDPKYQMETEEDAKTLGLLINEALTADVAPVRHGRWIYGNGYRSCPICHDGRRTVAVDNYCPNCGARMQAEKAQPQSTLD